MLPAELPKWVHRKHAKGRVYLYFDTGQTDPKGKKIFVRLPDYHDSAFHREYASLKDTREGRSQPAQFILTVPMLCERWRASWAKRRKPLAAATVSAYETYLRVIAAELEGFPAAEVEPRDVHQLHLKLADRPGAANLCIKTLSAMYSWAKKPQVSLVAANPAENIDPYELGEHEPWPEELLEQALAADDPFIRLVSNLLYFGGQRIGDTCAMGWRKILGDYEHMAVKQEKTDDELVIAIHSDLRAVLRAHPRGLGTIIAKPNGAPYSQGRVRERLQEWAAEQGYKVVPHGLRKNSVNGLLEAECSAAQVNAITGQSMTMIEHYAKKRNRKKLSESAVLRWENARRT